MNQHCEHTPIGLSIGQASGITGLSVRTIERYVRRFPEGFASEARMATRKRFNWQDVQTLTTISLMLKRRRPAALVSLALSGDLAARELPHVNGLTLLHMYQNVETSRAEAAKMCEEATSLRKKRSEFWTETWKTQSGLMRQVELLTERVEMLEKDLEDVTSGRKGEESKLRGFFLAQRRRSIAEEAHRRNRGRT